MTEKHTSLSDAAVKVWETLETIPTFEPGLPDKNPMFLETRVYQGSSGKVYPLPFTDRVALEKKDRAWKAVWLENQFIQVMVLPEIGGRIHAALDKTNNYDFIYRQTVIKPALVGLAGPWISGGIEFNWPQHHRPATFMPVDYHIEKHDDGSVTLWCSDHDPMCRMKGMHGICLHPDKAYIELKVRAYNRTQHVQTFLWWANVATRVHESYQSFFPPDVFYVADHAKRAMSEYPLAQGHYYGVDYGARGRDGVPPEERPSQFIPPHCGGQAPVGYPPNDLSWYANIPVPTSYMCMGSQEDFFGGYDHFKQAGLVHVANHHIAPGKKQWTWGNHEFGNAWDRNLTETDGPYIELMSGVFTDNQPDFAFLQPGETKTWTQYWYPIQKIGPAQHANLRAALSLQIDAKKICVGVSVTGLFPKAVIRLKYQKRVMEWNADLAPGKSFVVECRQSKSKWPSIGTTLSVVDGKGQEIIAYTTKPRVKGDVPPPATEPPAPEDIASADELYITGLHLEQYRHATRCPTLYWREALRRDPLDSRCNNALGLWHLRRGEFGLAENCFRKAIERQTRRNPNPYDGEAHYNLGLCLRYLGRDDEAVATFYKATWNQAWAPAAYHALAELKCCSGQWEDARELAVRSLYLNPANNRAYNLVALTCRELGEDELAEKYLAHNLSVDPLDWWTRDLLGESLVCDLQTCLDIAHDYARAGFFRKAIELLETVQSPDRSLPDQSWGALPLVQYTLGWLCEKVGDKKSSIKHFRHAAVVSPDYCFPSRLEEIAILEAVMRANPEDAHAPYYLGNLLYDRRRHVEAIQLWEKSVRLNPGFSIPWRNLGIGYFNALKQPVKARKAYEKAFAANPNDSRLLYERDQLWKRLGVTPQKRLRELHKYKQLVNQRDDLVLELCALLNQTGQHQSALKVITERHFQPWEGGEGVALGLHVRTRLALGRQSLAAGDIETARRHFEQAMTSPPNLGEARHLLANQSDVHYYLGVALDKLGQKENARNFWSKAAYFKGDFQEMSVRAFSEMTYYSALAWGRLGNRAEARRLLKGLLEHARSLEKTEAKIDYFATSLPAMLLFQDDLQHRRQTTALFLQAQALWGLQQKRTATALLKKVLARDPNHALASDLLSET